MPAAGALFLMQTESTSRRVPLSDIVAELNTQLRLSEFAGDPSNNGLQVEGAPRGVAKICFGVDASPEFYEAALAHGADLLVVHHGISWGPSLARIAGSNYALVAPLIKADAALYAAHLPLDAHPTLGNNAGLARALGLQELQPFAQYHGYTIGMKGRFSEPIEWSAVLARLRAVCLDGDFRTFGPGEGRVQTDRKSVV